MKNHCITEFINENYINELIVNQDMIISMKMNLHCSKENSEAILTSSPGIHTAYQKHGGVLLVFLKLLKTEFDIVILTEIGSSNTDLVRHLLHDCDFYQVTPVNNMYGGFGIYISNNNNVIIIACDIDIDFVKFGNDNKINYLTILLWNQYLPYVNLSTRKTDFSAAYIDDIFIRIAKNYKAQLDKVMSGISTVTLPTICLAFSPLQLNRTITERDH